MNQISSNRRIITEYLTSHSDVSSSEIHEGIGNVIGYATLKRNLQSLVHEGVVITTGKGKSTRYAISPSYFISIPIDLDAYFEKEIDERTIQPEFSFELIKDLLPKASLFSPMELEKLESLLDKFRENTNQLTPEEFNKEFERLAIDLSWKSSQIEGNTYSLLETEYLLKEQQTAAGKTKDEATMLLNHKETLDFILTHRDFVHPLSIARIEDIHSMLIKELNVGRNLRKRRVGISGTNYKPLDNEFQIREALQAMCDLVNLKSNLFEKALLTLVLISYIQPFEDGNKRTARIISNALLMNENCCPLSFRTVDSIDYKKAMLVFYEQNNIDPFKQIFIDQFEFAVNTYF
jgi:Fic family protein